MSVPFLSPLGLPVLTVDPSSPPDGSTWARSDTGQWRGRVDGQTVEMGMPFWPRMKTARWYPTQTGSTNTLAMVANRAYATPFIVPKKLTLDGVAMEITTAGTAGSVRAGIYADDGDLNPGARAAVDFGTVSLTTTGVKTWAPSVALKAYTPYWIVIAAQGVTGSPAARVLSGVQSWIADLAATPALSSAQNCYHTDTGFTGAFPDPFGTVAGVSNGPRMSVKFS